MRRWAHHPHLLSWGQRLKTRLSLAADGLNRPFTQGTAAEGRVHAGSKAINSRQNDEDGRVDAPLEHAEPARPQLRSRRLRPAHNFQLGFLYQLPWQSGSGSANPRPGDGQRLAVERRLRHVQRLAVQRRRERQRPQHAENLQNADQVGDPKHVGEIGGSGHLLRSGVVGAADGRPLRQRGAQRVLRPWRREPGPLDLPGVHVRRAAGGSSSGPWAPTSPTRRSSPTPTATSRAATSCASRARCRAAYNERRLPAGTPLPVLARASRHTTGPGRTSCRALRLYAARDYRRFGRSPRSARQVS